MLRPWLLGLGIAEACLMSILLLAILSKLCGLIQQTALEVIEFIVMGLFLIKCLLWIIMEFVLFLAVIGPHCTGVIYAYGVVQAVVYGAILAVTCFFGNRR